MAPHEINQFLAEIFPQSKGCQVLSCDDGLVRVKLFVEHEHLRPGGTISGPTMFALADFALYAAILNRLGPEAMAVTTNININFLNKPAANQDLFGVCNLIKVGKRLAFGEVSLFSKDEQGVHVAQASGSYSIP